MIKGIRIKGMKELRARLEKLKADARLAVDRAVYVAGNAVMTEAKQRAPVDFGTLRNSGYVTLPQEGKVEVGFGGAAKEYALVQHEREDFHHEVGEAKFLENAIAATDVQGIVEQEMSRGIIDGDTALPGSSHKTSSD